ncbi:DUF2269 family protein [Mesorhizobium sp. BAC0120]|uniref:DUF2269 family protein n=1 Tax=Mesorhizobium sp. BAC0120 TaxID=3090670 RepID=UPI00399BCB98
MEDILRFVHVIGATVLFGTGLGIAFFMVMAHRTGDAAKIAHVAETVVIADAAFTATAVILQPITGVLLAHQVGWPLTEGWVVLSVALYGVAGLFWLPVVAIQIRLRNIAREAASSGTPLPKQYHRLYRVWFAFGFPAFFAVLAIFWLMLTRSPIPIPFMASP